MNPILIVDRVSKKYSLRPQHTKRHSLADFGRELFGGKRTTKLREHEFWAVRDISFTMFPGESLALVGRNGSGKSTLLKMLNGLIPLDEGNITITPATQALINLGAGFHPNLTGRNNIYNSAALLGLSKKETDGIVERVIDFSELGEFIDSPVSTYSSGMYARLGFSVAINLRPRLMLIDEILSVGDQAFKNKCLLHMQKLKKKGIGMILVSHNKTQIVQFCERAVWIERGKMVSFGDSHKVVDEYLHFIEKHKTQKKLEQSVKSTNKPTERETGLFGIIQPPTKHIANISVRLLCDGKPTSTVKVNSDIVLEYEFDVLETILGLNISVVIFREDGIPMTAVSTLNGDLTGDTQPGHVTGRLHIKDITINPGNYFVVLPVHMGSGHVFRDVVYKFIVVRRDILTWGDATYKYDYTLTLPGHNDPVEYVYDPTDNH